MRRAGQVDDELAHVFDGLRLALGQQAGLVAFQDCASLSPACRQRPDKPSSPRHIPVPTIPGQSALTVTPSRATSLARALLKPITANFEAQ